MKHVLHMSQRALLHARSAAPVKHSISAARCTAQLSTAAARCTNVATNRRLNSDGGIGESTHVLQSDYAPTPLLETGLTEYLLSRCAAHSHRQAFVDGVTGRGVTYGALIDGVQRWAAVVQKRIVAGRPLPTVGLFMHNCPDYPMLFLGTTAVGATVTPLNPAYTAEEAARQLEDSGTEILVAGADLENTALHALRLLRSRREKDGREVELFVCGESAAGHSDLRGLLKDPAAPFANPVTVDPASIAMLPYSSGTTGLPKGVCIQNSAVVHNIEMFRTPEFLQQAEKTDEDVIMGLLPLYHIYGILAFMGVGIANGDKTVTLPKFDPHNFIKTIRNYKPTVIPAVPSLIKFMIESRELLREDLQQCHTVFCGAAPLSISTVEKFKEKSQSNSLLFQEGYGMTEILATHCTPSQDPKIGYCGKLLPHCQAKVLDIDTGEALPPGKEGELLVKTPCMMAGYYNNPDATKSTIDGDGWLHTGDVAVYTEDGYFSIVDRIKELIKVKGLQVSPSELESVLLKHPNIADVGVVAVPHDRNGEAPRAYIIKSHRGNITEEEVHNYMKTKISPHKQLLGGIKFVTELPKNPTGKLLRRILSETARKEVQ